MAQLLRLALILSCCPVATLGCAARQTEPVPAAGEPVAIAPAGSAPTPSADSSATPAAELPATSVEPSARKQPGPLEQKEVAPPSAARGPVLGSVCSPSAGSGLDVCGTQGRVSLELDSATVALVGGARCEPKKLPEQNIYAPLGCVSDGVLYAGSVCFACRLVDSGWSARAVILELTKEQATGLQKRLGLDFSLG